MTSKHLWNKVNVLLVFLFIIVCYSFFSSRKAQTKPFEVSSYIQHHTRQLISLLNQSSKLADSVLVPKRISQLRSIYFLTRQHYKQMEFFLEYYSPFDVKYFINGPLVKKSDQEIGKRIVDPHGFQVIEEQLFAKDSIDRSVLVMELQLLKESFETVEHKLTDLKVTDSQLIEMMQFELIRLSSLNLNGYDATYTQTNTKECSDVLKGFGDVLNGIRKNHSSKVYPLETHQQLMVRLKQAQWYCLKNADYDTFNRLYFITQYIKPIYKLLVRLHRSELFPFTTVNYAIRLDNDHVFEKESYHLSYFSIQGMDTSGHAMQAQLGELLFFDPVLSGNNQRACASCHKPELAFSDGLPKAIEFENEHPLDRNTPSLLNTIFQKHFFYDGRARQLEQQTNDVLHNQKEMNTSIDEMIDKLNQSREYQVLFKHAYKGTVDTTISYYGILKAITEYEKTLISLNSRFDQYLRGNYQQLSASEINGYNVFSGKALCGSCHFFPLFSGLVPPIYHDTEYEVIGVPERAGSRRIDKDEGRILVSKAYIHQYAFKTPTIRNSQLTAPYMHNGIYNTLDEVIDFYHKGGGQGLGIHIPHQTLPFDSLPLNQEEVRDIKAFMMSLTDTVGLTRKPKKLPAFNNEQLNKRVIGGVY